MLVCCSLPAATPPSMKAAAASTEAAAGQCARHPIAPTARPPTRRCANTMRSKVCSDGALSKSDQATKAGEKISDCGSATLGCPPKWYGFQKGETPDEIEAARKRKKA